MELTKQLREKAAKPAEQDKLQVANVQRQQELKLKYDAAVLVPNNMLKDKYWEAVVRGCVPSFQLRVPLWNPTCP